MGKPRTGKREPKRGTRNDLGTWHENRGAISPKSENYESMLSARHDVSTERLFPSSTEEKKEVVDVRELPRYAKQRFGVSGWISSNLGTMDDKWTSNARFTHSGLPLEIPRPWLGGGSCGQPGKRWENPGGPRFAIHTRGETWRRGLFFIATPLMSSLYPSSSRPALECVACEVGHS